MIIFFRTLLILSVGLAWAYHCRYGSLLLTLSETWPSPGTLFLSWSEKVWQHQDILLARLAFRKGAHEIPSHYHVTTFDLWWYNIPFSAFQSGKIFGLSWTACTRPKYQGSSLSPMLDTGVSSASVNLYNLSGTWCRAPYRHIILESYPCLVYQRSSSNHTSGIYYA